MVIALRARQPLVLHVPVDMEVIGHLHIHLIPTHHRAAIGVAIAAAAGLLAVQDRAGRKRARLLITRLLKCNH